MVKLQKVVKRSIYIIQYLAFFKKKRTHSKPGNPALTVNTYQIALNEN